MNPIKDYLVSLMIDNQYLHSADVIIGLEENPLKLLIVTNTIIEPGRIPWFIVQLPTQNHMREETGGAIRFCTKDGSRWFRGKLSFPFKEVILDKELDHPFDRDDGSIVWSCEQAVEKYVKRMGL